MRARESPAGGQSAGQKPEPVGASRHHESTPHDDGQIERTLDDELEAARRRDEGVDRALHGSHTWVRINLERHLDALISSGVEFTSDTLRERAEVIATSPNVVGALIRSASAKGRIVMVGIRESRRPEAHSRALRVWRRAS